MIHLKAHCKSDTRPPNVPQRHANQARHARYAVHASTIFLSEFLSIENKGSKVKIPKLKVASSSLVARSIFPKQFFGVVFNVRQIQQTSRRFILHNCQSSKS